jgi:hypothetical protein
MKSLLIFAAIILGCCLQSKKIPQENRIKELIDHPESEEFWLN